MKKVKFLVTSVLSFMLLTSSVYAACNYEEKAKLNNESANVKANYEIKERKLTKDAVSYTHLTLPTNMTV